MTDEQIIMAADICRTGKCNGCPYHGLYTAGCVTELIKDVFGFINRQKAENEELRSDKVIAERHEKDARELFVDCTRQLEEAKVEIERLNMDNKQLQSDVINANQNWDHIKRLWECEKEKVESSKQKVICACKMLKTAKSEAIKEFAENLKEEMRLDDDCKYDCAQCHYDCKDYIPFIDNLIEEMTEVQECVRKNILMPTDCPSK